MERLEGIPFNRLDRIDEARLDRHDLAICGVRAYLAQIFEIGLFHADPHPGNIFALPGGRIGFTDFGRVGTVSAGVGDTVSGLLLGMVDRDADLVTDALMDISGEPSRIDVERLRREMSVLVGKYHGAELGQFRVGEVLNDMLDVFRTHQLGLPSDLMMLLATMAVLEGVGRELDPGFDLIEAARPYADRMIKQQFQPDQLGRQAARTMRRWIRTVSDLPSSVDRTLRRIAEGELRVAIRPQGYERLLDRAEEMVDRLAFAVLIAAFVIGFSTLLSVEGLPAWLQILLALGMVGAIGVSAWMFASLLLARWRSKGPD
jgi:ubiquinone biosynthesis protein